MSLLPFTGNEHQDNVAGICFSLQGYLVLIDETGRILRDDKRGVISDKGWFKLAQGFECIFTGAVGTAEHLCLFNEYLGLQRTHGIANACLNSA